MDPPETPTPASRHTSIPRLSRLPVPKSGPALRPSPSRESLPGRSANGLSIPRLRSAPSRENLEYRSRTLSSNARERDESVDYVIHKPHQPSLLSKGPVRSSAISSAKTPTVASQAIDMPPPTRDLDYDAAIYSQEDVITEEDHHDDEAPSTRQSRPSLSERTMETLAQIPASPAMRTRGSSFYENTTSPTRPTSSSINSFRSRSDNLSGPVSKLTLGSRPGSSYSRDGSLGPPSSRSISSRPTSSAGEGGDSWIPKPFKAVPHTSTGFLEDQHDEFVDEHDTPYAAPSKLPSPGFYSSRQRSPSPMRPTSNTASVASDNSTAPRKTIKPQRSINGMFNKPSVGLISADILEKPRAVERKASNSQLGLATKRNVPPPRTKSTISTKSLKSTSSQSSDNPTSPKKPSAAQSSSLLREQIAKAKAAKRAQLNKQSGGAVAQGNAPSTAFTEDNFDFGHADDPFNQLAGQDGNKGLLRKRIDAGRTDGRLNIAAMGLKEIPSEVMSMYDIEDATGGSWAEMVDLTRLVAADNEFEVIPDSVFPDIDAETAMELDDWKGNQFGGLETLDLHGNVLISLPLGLRRLELLTTLNVSNNKLVNDAFDVISLIPSLKDLKIGVNNLTGELPASISKLEHLETLDIQRNNLTSLPSSLKDLKRLRIINLSENNLTSLSFDILQHLPLTQILAAKNKLSGTLIDSSVTGLSELQILDVTSNALTSISDVENFDLPVLHQLSCSANRLTNLPNLTSWHSLMILAAEDNSVSDIPTGFIDLPKIKNVDFTGNNIRVLPDEIGGMESLDIFRISGNPLREKKLAGMSTEELKRTLKARLEPSSPPSETIADETGTDSQPLTTSSSTAPQTWPVTMNKLDRSNTQSRTLNPVIVAQIAQAHTIYTLNLHHNTFRDIPTSTAFFAATMTSLTISHNELTRDEYLDEELSLPALQTLNLSSNTISDVRPLLARLDAPNLETLDLSFNRLTSLPVLRAKFPKLTTLLVGNNTIRELSVDAVRGLRVLDASSNELQSLNPKLGLLWDEGLRQLSVTGNRFRVPRWDVLEKGTEATCAWLRDRIPVDG